MIPFLALWKRLALSMSRNPLALLMTFLVPLILFLFFSLVLGGSGGGGSGGGITLLLVGEERDTLPLSRAFEDLGGVNPSLNFKGKETEVAWTEERARAAVAEGDASLALLLPPGWLRGILSFDEPRPEATLLVSRPDSPASRIAQGLLIPAVASALGEGGFSIVGDALLANLDRAVSLGEISVEQHKVWSSAWMTGEAAWESQGGEGKGTLGLEMDALIPLHAEVAEVEEGIPFSVSAYYAGATAVLFLLFTVVHLGGRLLKEEKNGYIRRILLGGTPVSSVLAAHIVHGTGLSLSALALMFWVAHQFLGAGLAGQTLPLLVVGILTGFAFGAFGILFAFFMPDRETLERSSSIVILPMSALGGSMIPLFMLPVWVQNIGKLLPNGQAVVAFEKVGARHMYLSEITPQLLYLVVFTVVAFGCATTLWKRRWVA
ncbi:ABC transporter permease [bacterium]|nr:ABC transporter permease [bacterium]